MKTLLLLRHAKSSWKSPALSDHDRPLNRRGTVDAPLMAAWLRAHGPVPSLLLSSTAVRAHATAQVFTETLGTGVELRTERLLYAASKDGLWRVVENIDQQIDTAMLVGHNPGLHDFVIQFAPSLEKFPTCALVGIAFETEDWALASANRARIILYEFPKNLKHA